MKERKNPLKLPLLKLCALIVLTLTAFFAGFSVFLATFMGEWIVQATIIALAIVLLFAYHVLVEPIIVWRGS